MADTIFIDVDLAANVKRDLSISTASISYSTPDLKKKIAAANDNSFLMIKKKIGSDLTILSVDVVDTNLIRKILH